MSKILLQIPKWLIVILLIFFAVLTGYAVVIKNYSVVFWPPKLLAPTAETSFLDIKDFPMINNKSLPKLSEGWKVVYPDKEYPNEEVSIHQTAATFTGQLYGSDATTYTIKGNIIPSRYITFMITSLNQKSDYFGIGLVRLSQEGNSAEGYIIHLDEKTELPKAARIHVIDKQR